MINALSSSFAAYTISKYIGNDLKLNDSLSNSIKKKKKQKDSANKQIECGNLSNH